MRSSSPGDRSGGGFDDLQLPKQSSPLKLPKYSVFLVLVIAFVLTGCSTRSLRPDGSRHRASEASAPARTQSSAVVDIQDVSRFSEVLALSDIHGMYENFRQTLYSYGLIDKKGDWAGKPVLLILNGDLVNKGPQSIEVLELAAKIQKQAAQMDRGQVIATLGNHEAFLLGAKHSKLQEHERFEPLRKELQTRRSKGLPYTSLLSLRNSFSGLGSFLKEMPAAVRVGKTIFMHSGFIPPDLTWEQFIDKANQKIAQEKYKSDFFLSEERGILQRRDWWADPKERELVIERAKKWGIERIVFGHQPGALGKNKKIAVSADHRLYKIDVGMAPDFGSNPARILIFRDPSELLKNDAPQSVFSTAKDLVNGDTNLKNVTRMAFEGMCLPTFGPGGVDEY